VFAMIYALAPLFKSKFGRSETEYSPNIQIFGFISADYCTTSSPASLQSNERGKRYSCTVRIRHQSTKKYSLF